MHIYGSLFSTRLFWSHLSSEIGPIGTVSRCRRWPRRSHRCSTRPLARSTSIFCPASSISPIQTGLTLHQLPACTMCSGYLTRPSLSSLMPHPLLRASLKLFESRFALMMIESLISSMTTASCSTITP